MIRVRIMALLAVTLAWATLVSPMTARADPGRTQADYTYLTTLHLKLGVPIGDSEADYDRVIAEGHGICKESTCGSESPPSESEPLWHSGEQS